MLTILSRTWMLNSRSRPNNMSEERGIQYQYNISEWIGYSKVDQVDVCKQPLPQCSTDGGRQLLVPLCPRRYCLHPPHLQEVGCPGIRWWKQKYTSDLTLKCRGLISTDPGWMSLWTTSSPPSTGSSCLSIATSGRWGQTNIVKLSYEHLSGGVSVEALHWRLHWARLWCSRGPQRRPCLLYTSDAADE